MNGKLQRKRYLVKVERVKSSRMEKSVASAQIRQTTQYSVADKRVKGSKKLRVIGSTSALMPSALAGNAMLTQKEPIPGVHTRTTLKENLREIIGGFLIGISIPRKEFRPGMEAIGK